MAERMRPATSVRWEVLADDSSIPVSEEELVCEKRLVVRERVIVGKHTVSDDCGVEADPLRSSARIASATM